MGRESRVQCGGARLLAGRSDHPAVGSPARCGRVGGAGGPAGPAGADFMIAVNEIATNAVRYGSPVAQLDLKIAGVAAPRFHPPAIRMRHETPGCDYVRGRVRAGNQSGPGRYEQICRLARSASETFDAAGARQRLEALAPQF